MMGQLMGALNHSALLDDLNINIESMHGGFDCNVEEVSLGRALPPPPCPSLTLLRRPVFPRLNRRVIRSVIELR